ncbi:MAG: hypothetical protein HYZ69_00670 [Candidatus Colwellbacteria bacterium]|nr:hypothetical protein [Candidatus Colwellbacteria bacterium]
MYKFFGISAGLLTLGGFFPMGIETVRRQVRPSRATWLIWAVEAILIYKTFATAVPNSSALWIPLGFTVGATVMFVLSLPFGEGGWATLDKFCLAGAGVTILIWQFAGPVAGLLAGIATDVIGAVPTVVKTWRDPKSESHTQWWFWWLGAIANLYAVSSWSLAEASYPIYGIVLTTTMVVVIQIRKRKRT